MENRYMCVSYYLRPTGKWDEITAFKKNLNKNTLQTAKVILDFKTNELVKNGLNPDASFDDMVIFYKRLMGKQLDQYLPEQYRDPEVIEAATSSVAA